MRYACNDNCVDADYVSVVNHNDGINNNIKGFTFGTFDCVYYYDDDYEIMNANNDAVDDDDDTGAKYDIFDDDNNNGYISNVKNDIVDNNVTVINNKNNIDEEKESPHPVSRSPSLNSSLHIIEVGCGVGMKFQNE